MTSARVFYGLLTIVTAAGVTTTLLPQLRTVVAIAGVMFGALAVVASVATLVVAEVRWNREVDRLIAEPLAVATDREEVAR